MERSRNVQKAAKKDWQIQMEAAGSGGIAKKHHL